MTAKQKFREIYGIMRQARMEVKAGYEGPGFASMVKWPVTESLDDELFKAAMKASYVRAYGFRASPMGVEIINRADQGDQAKRLAMPRAELIREYIRQAKFRADKRSLGFTKDYFPYTQFPRWRPELSILLYENRRASTEAEKAYADAVLPAISEIDPNYFTMARATDLNIFESEAERRFENGDYMEENEYGHE